MASRDSNELPEVFQLILLRDECRRFIAENKITRLGDIWDVYTDRDEVMGFIESVCDIIGYYGQER